MQTDDRDKENKRTQSIAVGGKTFIEKMKKTLGHRATGKKVISADDTFELREPITPFGNATARMRRSLLSTKRHPRFIQNSRSRRRFL
jgi:hypothetical protein